MLRKLGLAGAASVLMISSVKAADIEAPPAAYDWSGFYVGANLGYAFSDGYDVVATNQIGEESKFGDISLEGINGGVQLGTISSWTALYSAWKPTLKLQTLTTTSMTWLAQLLERPRTFARKLISSERFALVWASLGTMY
jgi:opacity protein-like surface antigen